MIESKDVQYKIGAHGFVYMRVLNDWKRAALTVGEYHEIINGIEAQRVRLANQRLRAIERDKRTTEKFKQARLKKEKATLKRAITKMLKSNKKRSGKKKA